VAALIQMVGQSQPLQPCALRTVDDGVLEGGPMSANTGESAQRWLLLHGTPLRASVWSAVSAHLPGTAWAPDVTPAPGTAHPQRHLAERIIAKVRQRGGRWNVVGHSFGGQIALEIACLAPDVVDDLVIVCSRDTPFPSFAAAADSLDAGNPIDLAAALHRWFRPSEIADHPAFIDDITAELRRADRRSWATALRGIADFDATAAVPGISAPATRDRGRVRPGRHPGGDG
jgi:pimeloyl-ACP methyl ester carboxylesterase